MLPGTLGGMDNAIAIGSWARIGRLVGIVSRVEDDGTVVVFNPGDRQMARATPDAVQGLPSGAVEVTATVRLDVPHGLGEESVQRWVAALIDPVLRQRARDSLVEAGLDGAAFATDPEVEVREIPSEE